MKAVGFIGAYDKTDLIIYVAKILTAINKKVLIIDATILQKAKYIVPKMLPARTYITTYEDIDIAVGFYNYNEIKEYLGISEDTALEYDYIFLDIDSPEAFESYEASKNDKNYFITAFDNYSIKRGIEILSVITEPIPLKKIFFSKNITKEEDDYFNYLSLGAKAIWDEEKIYFPLEHGDESVILENQRASKIKFKYLTQFYRESLLYIVTELLEEQERNINFKKIMKQIEKGV